MAYEHEIYGIDAPPPRPTAWAGIWAVLLLGLPFLGVLLLADGVLWLVFRLAGRCYGVWC